MGCFEFVLITLINALFFGVIIFHNLYRSCNISCQNNLLLLLLSLLLNLILKIKKIDLAIEFTVCLTQEMVQQVSLENQRNAKDDFAFIVFSIRKRFEKKTCSREQHFYKRYIKIKVLSLLLIETLWELKNEAIFRRFFSFFLFSKLKSLNQFSF